MTERAFKGVLILLALIGLMMFWQGRSWAANRYVNNVATSAFFIDDTFTGTGNSAWGTYYGYRLTARDSSGNQAIGWVGAVGTGVSTFGGERVTNGNMETGDPPSSWVVGSGASLAAVADERTGGAGSKSLSVLATSTYDSASQSPAVSGVGALNYISIWAKNQSGTGGTVTFYDNVTTNIVAATLTAGWIRYDKFWTTRDSLSDALNLYGAFDSYGAGYEARFDDVSVKPVLTPGSTGCSIYSSAALTTNSWASVDASFNPNAITSLTLDLIPNGTYDLLDYSSTNPFFTPAKTTELSAVGISKHTEAIRNNPGARIVFESTGGGTAESTIGAYSGAASGVSECNADPAFDSPGWTCDAGWAVAGSVATGTATSNSVYRAMLVSPFGKLYRSTFTITAITGGNVKSRIAATNGSNRATTGTFIDYVTASATSLNAGLSGSGFTGVCDDLYVQLLTSPGPNGCLLGPVTATGSFNPNAITKFKILQPVSPREQRRHRTGPWRTVWDSSVN